MHTPLSRTDMPAAWPAVTPTGLRECIIAAILQLYKSYGKVTDPKTDPHANHTGQKHVLNPNLNDLRYIQSLLEAQPTSYLDEIQENLFQNCEILVLLATLS